MDTNLAATAANSLLFRAESSHGHNSPNKSPRRLNTDPNLSSTDELRLRVNKRIIVCCDGTWQDGISEHRSNYTNVLRLARTISHADERYQPPIPQIVFYQSGIGTEKNFYSEYVEGTTGGSLADKVEEAYAFIAHNFNPGDEIFLFGFSRGAYTARMVAMFIGEIGVLDRKDMDYFAGLFISFQKLGKCSNSKETLALRQQVERWCKPDSPGKLRADCDKDTFTVKCVGVFDTVGSLGLPEELTMRSTKVRNLFGFPDRILGEHIERAYQALALHETRADFNCNKFEQTENGRLKGQVLKQCWFTGAHSDIGGGYPEHDLADVTLTWMVAHIGDILAMDVHYLSRLPQPVAPWGQQKAHDSRTGIFFLSHTLQRPLPTYNNNTTHESIHSSVLEQAKVYPVLERVLRNHPEIVCPLLPLEEEIKVNWPYIPESPVAQSYSSQLENQIKTQTQTTVTQDIIRTGSKLGRSLFRSFSVSKRQISQGSETDLKTEMVAVYEQRVDVSTTLKLKKSRRKSTLAGP